MWPKTIFFVSEPEELARYICFTARSIQVRKFPMGGFLVLPYLVPGNPKAVHFPDLGFSARFWKRLKQHEKYSLTQDFPKEAIDEAVAHLTSYVIPDTKYIMQDFNNHLPEFISLGQKVLDFDTFLPKIAEIKILLTEFGTAGSFSKKQLSDGRWNIYITSRTDMPWQNIFKTLIQAFIIITQVGQINDVGTVGWYQRNAILKYLIEHTPFKDLLKFNSPSHYEGEGSGVRLLDNLKYLSKLGYPPTPNLDVQKLQQELTPQEKDLFDALYNSKGVLITFDQAAEVVWKDEVEEKYSLQALAKLIEGIRKKIKQQGIHQDIISTLRRRGYLLTV